MDANKEEFSVIDHMESRRKDGEHNPLTATFELTQKCNLRCCHCYLEHRQEGSELPASRWLAFIDEVADFGAYFASFTGGEVFLRPDLLEIARCALKRGIFFQFQTNGTYIDAEMAAVIQDLQPTKVEISIYGPNGAIHDRITGIRGSFDKSMRAIELLRKRNINVILKASVMPENKNHVQAMRKLADDAGLWIMFDANIMPGVFGSEKPLTYRMNNDEYRDYMIAENWGNAPGKELQHIRDDISRPDRRVLCTAAKKRFTITAIGEIIPCPIWRQSCGSLLDQSLASIWYGEKMTEMRKLKFEDLKNCASCKTYESCTRCAGLAFLESGDYRSCPQESLRVSSLLNQLRAEKQKSSNNDSDISSPGPGHDE